MSALVDSKFKVIKGEKGRLINKHDNPRKVVEPDYAKDFESCTGGPDQAQSIIELFNKLNDGDKNQKIMVDGIIANLLTTTDVNKRTLSFVVKIGTGRIKRIRDGKSKQTDFAHLSG